MSELNANQENAAQNNTPDPNYWRSFEALHNDPEVLEAKNHEFKEGVTDKFHLLNHTFPLLIFGESELNW